VRELLSELGHDPDRSGIAVALNGAVLPRARWSEQIVGPGDAIEIVGAVQGG
jgi:sulfur carrier protein